MYYIRPLMVDGGRITAEGTDGPCPVHDFCGDQAAPGAAKQVDGLARDPDRRRYQAELLPVAQGRRGDASAPGQLAMVK